MEYFEIGTLEDIPRLGSRVLNTERGRIAIFRTSDDQVFAIRDNCPHKAGPLSQGIVSGTTVTCPLHNWKIDLKTGEALGPDQGCSNTYEVIKKDDGRLYMKTQPNPRSSAV